MDETIKLLAQLGSAVVVVYLVYLTSKVWAPLVGKQKNDNGITELRVRTLEDRVEKLEGKNHDVIMPTLRWHSYQGTEKCKWERSSTLLP